MENTDFNKMIVAGAGFPEERTINFAIQMPAPENVTRYAKELAQRATVETQGEVSTLSVGDSATGWLKAQKDTSVANGQWIGKRDMELGWSEDNARQILAMQLVSEELTDAAVMRHLSVYELDSDDILEAVMYPGASLVPVEEDARRKTEYGDLLVHGYCPAPQAYMDLAHDIAKTTITNDEQSYVVVGSKETGFLAAVKNESSGVWESHSDQYTGYNICHNAEKNALEVAKELCSDLAVYRLEPEEIVDQIIDHGLQPEAIDFIEVIGTPRVITPGEGYANMPDPDGVFRNILGRLGGHDL